MKRKGYFSFLFPRFAAALIVGAIIFGITYLSLSSCYETALDAGINNRKDVYAKMLKNYDKGSYDTTFIDIVCNLYSADYLRFARINDDGSFETITETDYNIVPVEDGLHHWYYITKDEELLGKGKRTVRVNDSDWTIEYKKCDEAWELCKYADTKINNSYDLTALSGYVYSADRFYLLSNELCGMLQFFEPAAITYYVEGDTVHLGKIYGSAIVKNSQFKIGKQWDLTDKSKADLYKTHYWEDGLAERGLLVFPKRERPDHFFAKFGNVFLAKNLSELQKAYEDLSARDTDSSFEGFSRHSDVTGLRENEHTYSATTDDNCTGVIDIVNINGKLYMAEYVVTTVPFATYFKPFLIIWAVFLFIAALVIACLASGRPYRQYKKAYENNNFKNNLIDSLAHNMKTPLQILGGYAENLKDVTSDTEKDRYADQILAKTAEMNKDIEAILKTAEKSDRKFVKESIRTCIDEVASKLGAEVFAKGDMKIRMDKDYFKTAIYCLLDNAMKYKSADSKIEIDITCKAVTIKNRTDKDKFTPGTGIAIAGRILEQHKLKMRTTLKDGVFEVKFGKKLGKEKNRIR